MPCRNPRTQARPAPLFLPHGDPISKALTEKSVADKVPLLTTGYGRTEAIDGRVFPYSITVLFSFWSEASSAMTPTTHDRAQRKNDA